MIHTTHLFPLLDQKLIELLRTLSANDWNKPTLAKRWTVKDIAAHLLDGNLRTLSFSRDGYALLPDRNIASYADLVGYLNHLNAEWTAAAKRLSPRVLIELLEQTGNQYTAHIASLDPEADAIFSVAWTGEQQSKNWFHIAREYTEKWHHQQQIREAVSRPGIMTPELFCPFIETLLQGLPHTYRHTEVAVGTVVQITIATALGGTWYLTRGQDAWHLSKTTPAAVQATVTMQPDTAWKLFTKAIRPDDALTQVDLSGDNALAKIALALVAVMA